MRVAPLQVPRTIACMQDALHLSDEQVQQLLQHGGAFQQQSADLREICACTARVRVEEWQHPCYSAHLGATASHGLSLHANLHTLMLQSPGARRRTPHLQVLEQEKEDADKPDALMSAGFLQVPHRTWVPPCRNAQVPVHAMQATSQVSTIRHMSCSTATPGD